MPIKYRKYLIAPMMLPAVCYADGGGPLLLFISGSAFIVGQVWILIIETVLLKRVSGLGVLMALKNTFFANLISTVVIGFGLPIVLAIVTGFAMALPQPIGGYASAAGTWIYEGAPYGKYLGYISLGWLAVTFILTVYCEKAFYLKYWRKIGFVPNFSINKFVWRANASSYSGLLIIIVAMWHELFGGM